MPQWMHDEITSDLAPFSSRLGESVRLFTHADLDKMETQWGHVACRFRVQGQTLTTCDPYTVDMLRGGPGSEIWGQYASMAKATRGLLANGLLPDGLDFFVSPQIFDFVEMQVPIFSKARTAFAQGIIRTPSYELLGPWIDKTRAKLGAPVEWHLKKPQLYWRGGMRSFNACPCSVARLAWPLNWAKFNLSRLLATEFIGRGECKDLPSSLCKEATRRLGGCICHRFFTNASTIDWSNRVRLCELSQQHPEFIDARLSYVPDSYGVVKDMCQQRGYMAEFSRFDDHSHFRYLMSTDGSTIDDTRVYWMLSTGSVVFKQVTSLLPYGVPGLQPWKHFIPVREDLRDLISKIRWARQNDAICREIAERARSFAAEFFTEDQILHYVQRSLMEYSKLFE